MYAHVVVCTGWTWDYIDQHMDIPRLLAMTNYWQSHPPLHLMVASYLGIQPAKKNIISENHQNTPESLNEFAQTFAAFGGGVN